MIDLSGLDSTYFTLKYSAINPIFRKLHSKADTRLMKRLLILLAILALPALLQAQNISAGSMQHISVASFRSLPNDMTARVTDPVKDRNGDKCALIKIVTTAQGMHFEGGMLGIMEAPWKNGEYWVYVPYGAKKLTIKHDKLGILRNYLYPEPIEEATVYEMVLTTAKVTTIIEDYVVPTQWLIIQSEPSVANVYLNDQHKGVTPFQMEMEEGHYTYRIDMPLYHAEAGAFDLAEADGKKRMNISLKPNFGYVQINTSPESGATVSIDGQLKAQKSPMKTERLKSGTHQIKVEKSMFYPAEQEVLVEDGRTKTLNLTMQPAFGGLSLSSTPESGATVFLDGNPTGKITPCTLERLSSGEHTIRLQKEWYQPAAKQINLKDGESASLSIEMQPTFGTVEISSIEGADIYVDGERKSSNTWTGRLIAGFHTIEARKDKHHSDKQKTEVLVGETHPISLHPEAKQGTIKIVTTPFDARISLNSIDHGLTPNTIKDVLIGDYQLKLSKEGYGTISKTITLKENETIEINEELPSGKEITISSTPSGAALSIDGQSYGATPWSGTLAFGSHTVKLIKGKRTVNEQIGISQNGKSSFSYDVSKICPATVSDADGNIYNTVKIGGQCWMKENLRVGKRINGSKGMSDGNRIEKYCYDNDRANCKTYGGLYQWGEMMQYTTQSGAQGICPKGWHIPTDGEWKTLEMALDISQSEADKSGWRGTDQGKQMKSTSGWTNNGNGTNSSGFNALPGGYRDSYGSFNYLGGYGYWWSSSENSGASAWLRDLHYDNGQVSRYLGNKTAGRSVRCLKDRLDAF